MVIESRTVLTSTVSGLGIPGQTATLYFVGKEGVTGTSDFTVDNIDFFTLDGSSDILLTDGFRVRNFNQGSETSNYYDISNIDVITGTYGPSGNDPLTSGSYQFASSGLLATQEIADQFNFNPSNPTYPIDIEFRNIIDTSNTLTFNEISVSNLINKYFYQTPEGVDLFLDFSSVPFTPRPTDRVIAFFPTISVSVQQLPVFFPDPAPIPASRFSLSNIFYYNRSFSSLNNQKTFSAYSFLQLKNKLNRGFLERKR